MFCPRCATQNLDDVKFCRACGTNLETVALALSGQKTSAITGKDKNKKSKSEKSWLERRREGVDGIVKGIGLTAASLLIGLALGLFSNVADWIIIWVGLAGWMACWGVIELVSGIGALADSRFMRRLLAETASETPAPIDQPLSSGNQGMLPDRSIAPALSTPPPSVTEQTTQPLTKQHQTSKQVS
jgi:hypothetical protein